jgi:DNA-binding beta-propeller fold protein YncE
MRTSAALGTSPGPIALDDGALWVGDVEDETLLHVDPRTMRVLRTIGLGIVPSDVVASEGTVWVTSAADGLLVPVNAATDKVEARIDLGEGGRGATPVAVARRWWPSGRPASGSGTRTSSRC